MEEQSTQINDAKMAEKLAKSQALMSSNDLKTLGIDEAKFRELSLKEQKQFIALHALEGTLISKSRATRDRPDLTIPRKTTFRYIWAYLWVPYNDYLSQPFFSRQFRRYRLCYYPLCLRK